MVQHDKNMTKTIQIIAASFILLSSSAFADQKLKVTRYPTKNVHAGKVQRIDFPPGFSVEYSYDQEGHLSKKKLFNFKHVIDCPNESPCELTPESDAFLQIVIDETIQGKLSSIPSMLNAAERLHKPANEGLIDDLIGIWKTIELTYWTATIGEKKEILEKYKESALKFEQELNQKKTWMEQSRFIFADLAKKVPTVETFEYMSLPKMVPLEGKELEDISGNLSRIGSCQPLLENKFRDMLERGNLLREKAVTTEQFNEVYSLVQDNILTISQESPAIKTVNIDLNWVNEVGTATSNRAAMIVGDILLSQPRLMHTTRTILSVLEPKIGISDRVMLYYPNQIQKTAFNDVDVTHRQQFLGDGTVRVADVFGNNYSYFFEWMLAHEYGHVLQNEVWFHRMEVDKMSALARIALKYDQKWKQNFIRPELRDKIQTDLLDPLGSIVEQSASYFALDNLACF